MRINLKKIDLLIKIFTIIMSLTYAIDGWFYFREILFFINIILIGYRIYKNPISFIKFRYIVLMIFVITYIVTMIYNINTFAIDNIYQLQDVLLLFFGVMYFDEVYNYDKFIDIFMFGYGVIAFFISIIDIFMYIFAVEGKYYIAQHYERYGVYEGRLWGLFNANVTAMIAVFAIVFSFILVIKHRYKMFNIINILLNVYVLFLSQSRSALIVFLIMIIGTSFFYGIDKKRRVKYLFLGILFAICTYLASDLCVNISSGIMIKKEVVAATKNTKNNKIDNSKNKKVVKRKTVKKNILQGRASIWKDSIKLVKRKPIFGNGFYELKERPDKFFSKSSALIVKLAGVHNIYLMILVVNGILGLGVIFIFLTYMIYKYVRYVCKTNTDLTIKVLMLMVICVLVSELVESRILYTLNYFAYIFWLMVGYTLSKIGDTNEKK